MGTVAARRSASQSSNESHILSGQLAYLGTAGLLALARPMYVAVGVEDVGGPVEAHHHAIDVISLGQQFHNGHEGVEIECTAYHHLVMFPATLAISQFNTVVQNEALGFSLNFVCFHNSLY